MNSLKKQKNYGISKLKKEIIEKISPEIGNQIILLFRKGLEQKEIGAEILEGESEFAGYTSEMLRSAISSYLVENMDTKERKKISEQHIKVASQRRMNNLSKEERIKRATLGGQVAKQITSLEEYQERGKMGVLKQGYTPFSNEEIVGLSLLLNDITYQIQSGLNKRFPNYALIAKTLNESFHEGNPIRKKDSLQKWISKPQNKKKITIAEQEDI